RPQRDARPAVQRRVLRLELHPDQRARRAVVWRQLDGADLAYRHAAHHDVVAGHDLRGRYDIGRDLVRPGPALHDEARGGAGRQQRDDGECLHRAGSPRISWTADGTSADCWAPAAPAAAVGGTAAALPPTGSGFNVDGSAGWRSAVAGSSRTVIRKEWPCESVWENAEIHSWASDTASGWLTESWLLG